MRVGSVLSRHGRVAHLDCPVQRGQLRKAGVAVKKKFSEETRLLYSLAIALDALRKIEQRKLEDIPGDKHKDEFHKTLMATAAWTYCMFTARDAIARIREAMSFER
jgi:hypothetical protein